MFEFAVFFVLPFDDTIPRGSGDEAIERVKQVKNEAEEKCLEAFHAIIPKEKRQNHKVWAQSRIDLEMRIIGASLRLPIEKGADRDVVKTVREDDFLYWDYDELSDCMNAMYKAVTGVAAEYGATAHAAFSDVRYHY